MNRYRAGGWLATAALVGLLFGIGGCGGGGHSTPVAHPLALAPMPATAVNTAAVATAAARLGDGVAKPPLSE